LIGKINPYAPPQGDPSGGDGATKGRFSGALLKWVFLAIETSRIAAAALTHVVRVDESAFELIDGYWRYGAIIGSLVGLVWLGSACGALPQRALDAAKLSTGRAIGFLFVPCLNIVWIFVVHLRLCEALDTAMVAVDRPPPKLQALAMTAVVMHFASSFAPLVDDTLVNLLADSVTAAAWLASLFPFDKALARLDGALRADASRALAATVG
jgi:hypothetical protein